MTFSADTAVKLESLQKEVATLRELPAFRQQIVATDALAHDKRLATLDRIDAARAARVAAIDRLLPEIGKTEQAVREHDGAAAKARGRLNELKQQADSAELLAEHEERLAAADLSALGGLEIEQLAADLRFEVRQAGGLFDVRTTKNAYGVVTGVHSAAPDVDAHGAKCADLLKEAEVLRFERASPAEIRRRVEAIKAKARVGLAGEFAKARTGR